MQFADPFAETDAVAILGTPRILPTHTPNRAFMPETQELEFIAKVSGQAQWDELSAAHPELFGPELSPGIAEHIKAQGLEDPQLGFAPGSEVDIASPHYRETVIAHGLNARSRGILLVLKEALGLPDTRECRVYASEALSPLARRLAETVPGFIGSEYLPEAADQASHPEILHQDVTGLSFASGHFDAYVSCEVLEHIADVEAALKEAWRVLKPGGWLIGSVPFDPDRAQTQIRAELVDGQIHHLQEPAFHGNPTRPGEGSLVFNDFGWDFLDRICAAGFEAVGLQLIASQRYGVFGRKKAVLPFFVGKKPIDSPNGSD